MTEFLPMINIELSKKFPASPYNTMPGMSWDTDGEKVFVFLHNKLVMVLSVTEILDVRNKNVNNNKENC